MDYNTIPNDAALAETVQNMQGRAFDVSVVDTREQALDAIIKMIPQGATVMNGSSTTLQEIGFVDYLQKNEHDWQNMHTSLLAEKDPAKQRDLRRASVTADYFLGSVNAIAQTGELVAADATGSRISAYVFPARHVIIVSGTNKIVPTLADALARVRKHVYNLEDERAKKAYGFGTSLGKLVIIEKEALPHRLTVILVKEKLGF